MGSNDFWVIDVTGWGTIYLCGTEEEAEMWRVHKARWEHCIARKRLATDEEIDDPTIKWCANINTYRENGEISSSSLEPLSSL